jgi:hypothetical protein
MELIEEYILTNVIESLVLAASPLLYTKNKMHYITTKLEMREMIIF